ncbi:hypothetical protein BS78_05G071400 [Paspalum vaginatum]|nr:hypothetical protein BS78_05G071400 [Paspalum vaginatum]KAJ1274564.1 hypothetical protein BS78_05G071400 [Paspalum vaginatum]
MAQVIYQCSYVAQPVQTPTNSFLAATVSVTVFTKVEPVGSSCDAPAGDGWRRRCTLSRAASSGPGGGVELVRCGSRRQANFRRAPRMFTCHLLLFYGSIIAVAYLHHRPTTWRCGQLQCDKQAGCRGETAVRKPASYFWEWVTSCLTRSAQIGSNGLHRQVLFGQTNVSCAWFWRDVRFLLHSDL